MVDSSDTERIGTSAEEFHAILDEEELRDALILVYANKQACSLHPRVTGMRTVPALRRLTAQRCACRADMAEGTHYTSMGDGRPNRMGLLLWSLVPSVEQDAIVTRPWQAAGSS